MLDIENVYLFSAAEKRGCFRAQLGNENITEDYLFSSFNTDEVIDFKWYQGVTKYDVIPTSNAGIYLVSEKIKFILSDSSIKGYNLRPICLRDKNKEIIDGYYLFSVISQVGPINNDLSIRKIMPPRVSWANSYEGFIGLYFDINTWDSSDFFYPVGSLYIFSTEKIKKLFERNNVTNCKFQKIIEVENFGIV